MEKSELYPETIYHNYELDYIIKAISHGTVGVASIDDLLIINKVNPQYQQIAIKPALINISENVLDAIGEAKIQVRFFDDEITEFICLTNVIEEVEDDEGNVSKQPVCVVQSLSETILNDPDILKSYGWDLLNFNTETSINITEML